MTTKTVYTGTNDEISVTANTSLWDEDLQKDVLTPIPFIDNGATKVEVSFSDQILNSIDNADMISFDNNGKLIFKFNTLVNVSKNRANEAIVKVFDVDHPLGQTIIAPTREDSNLSLVFV